MPKASVILAVFNQPCALGFVLLGYQRQSVQDFELIIADDGSDDDTRRVIEQFKKTAPFEIKHVWQENKGFRRAMITNEAVKISQGRWLIFSDGDCIPHRDFVRVHLEQSQPNAFCVGGYLRLSAEYSQQLTAEKVLGGDFERHLTFGKHLVYSAVHVKSKFYIWIKRRRRPKGYGSNISVERDVFYGVNGYDENFAGFGKEDSDLCNRLLGYGAKPMSVWNRAFVFHIDPVVDPKRAITIIPRDNVKKWEYYRRAHIPVRCGNGLVKEEQKI